MKNKSIHLIYLNSDARNDRWSYLHRFFHPGTLEHDGKASLTSFHTDTTHYAFLAAKVRDFSNEGNRLIHIPYSMVDAMIELPFEGSRIGFHQSQEEIDDLYRNSKKA